MFLCFFFQAEDGIRDGRVTGVQTCALPISLDIEGLQSLTLKEARSYFMETATLLHPKSARVYTPEKLKHGLSSLTDILERDGYEQARAEASKVTQDDKNGHVFVKINVEQGPKSVVESVTEQFFYEPPA